MPLRLVNRSYSLAALLFAGLATVLSAAGPQEADASGESLATRALIVGLGDQLALSPFNSASLALVLPSGPSRAWRLELIASTHISNKRPTSDYKPVFSAKISGDIIQIWIQDIALGVQLYRLHYKKAAQNLVIYSGLGPRLTLVHRGSHPEFASITPEDSYPSTAEDFSTIDDFLPGAALGVGAVLGFSRRIGAHFWWQGEYSLHLDSFYTKVNTDNDPRTRPQTRTATSELGVDLSSGVSMGLAFEF